MIRSLSIIFIFLAVIVVAGPNAVGQDAPSAQNPQTPQSVQTQAPLTLTLQDALARARKYSIEFNAALTDQGVAHQDKIQARAALLPSVTYNNQYLYTEGNGGDQII